MAEPTTGPFTAHGNSVRDKNMGCVALTYDPAECRGEPDPEVVLANARFLALAASCHEQLVHACQIALQNIVTGRLVNEANYERTVALLEDALRAVRDQKREQEESV